VLSADVPVLSADDPTVLSADDPTMLSADDYAGAGTLD